MADCLKSTKISNDKLIRNSFIYYCKVQIGKDQEKAQSAKDSHSKNPRWEKTKLTIRYLCHENIS